MIKIAGLFVLGVLFSVEKGPQSAPFRFTADSFRPASVRQPDSTMLAGVIDFHCHSGPDVNERSLNDLQLVRLAKHAGMRGLVLKNHYTTTADRAALAMQEISGIEVFGGIVLNRSVGGLNLEAISRMLQFEGHCGKIVWLPTVDAENIVGHAAGHKPFIAVVRDGKPVPELADIFKLVAANDLVLETGHSSPAESLVLIPAAKRAGVKNIVVTHATGLGATPEQMKQMAEMGAVIELCWLNFISKPNVQAGTESVINTDAVARGVKAIRTIGAAHFLISSDMGQKNYPLHTNGIFSFMNSLLAGGISEHEIDLMARKNPARLLGLNQ